MNLLAVIAIARMAALQIRGTALLRFVLTSLLTAVIRRAFHVGTTEAALLACLVLLCLSACLAQMVGLLLARSTEVVLALGASDSMLAHVLGGSLVDDLAGVILDVIVDLAFNDLNHVAALALDHFFVPLEGLFGHLCLKFLVCLFAKSLSYLEIEELLATVIMRASSIGVAQVDALYETLLACYVVALLKNHDTLILESRATLLAL
jgi:hypothetical protein